MGHAVQHVSLDEWRQKLAAGEAPADVILRKQFIPDQVKAEGGDSRKVTFTISTASVDRDRDTLAVDGWKLDNYRKNPVVLWAHRYDDLPVGKAESILAKAGALKAVADFVPAEISPFADTVFRLLKGGFLRATSVGFRPMKYALNEDRRGIDFEEQELMEFSIVPVPANPEALMDAKGLGIDVAPLRKWAERVLDETSGEPGLWLPKSQVEATLAAIKAPSVAVNLDVEALAEALGGKSGRVLSRANEEKLREVQTALGAVAETVGTAHGAIGTLLSQVTEEEPKAAPTPTPTPAAEPVLLVKAEPTFAVNREDVTAAARAVVSEVAAGAVRRAAGRLD
jgi:HK97 family phage prohead protease